MSRPRVVLLRGHGVMPWELRPQEQLSDRFEIVCLATSGNRLLDERVRQMRPHVAVGASHGHSPVRVDVAEILTQVVETPGDPFRLRHQEIV
jgi:hypothetical protein